MYLCALAISLVGICYPNISSSNGFYDLFTWWLMQMGIQGLMQDVKLKSLEIRFKLEVQICYLKDFMFCIKYLLSSFVLIDMLLLLGVVVHPVWLFAEMTCVIKVVCVPGWFVLSCLLILKNVVVLKHLHKSYKHTLIEISSEHMAKILSNQLLREPVGC